MSVETIVKLIRSEIVVGMPRPEVEQKLKTFPVSYGYVPRTDLELTGETTSEGKPLSGRFDVFTPHERNLLLMNYAVIFIELDEQERVAAVRIQAFGFVPDA